MVLNPEGNLEPQPEPYRPSLGDLAAADALARGIAEEQDCIRQTDFILWTKALIGSQSNRYAGQVSDQELALFIKTPAARQWDPQFLEELNQYLMASLEDEIQKLG